MERGVNVVLRILIIVLCFVLAVSAVYLFSVRYVNSFYKADANDMFMSSMTVDAIYPMNDGRLNVVGTFLQGDDILSNPSVYVKMYGEDGRFIDVAGLSMERDFRLASSCSDGRVTVLLLVNNEDRAEIYSVSQEGKIDGSLSLSMAEDETGSVSYFAGTYGGGVFAATVAGGNRVTVKDIGGKTLFEKVLSEDVSVRGVSAAGGVFFMNGTLTGGDGKLPCVFAFDAEGKERFNITVSEDLSSFRIDGFTKARDGKTYMYGRRFNRQAYAEMFFPDATDEDRAVKFTSVSEKAISTEREFGAVLLSSDYYSDPWCTFFLCEISPDTGSLGLINTPLSDDSSFGISDVTFLPEGIALEEENGKTAVATMVSKVAASSSSDKYCVSCYRLYHDMSASGSAKIYMPSDFYCYPGTAADGRYFCYDGISDTSGTVRYSLKYYDGTESIAREQNLLSVMKYAVNLILGIVDRRLIAYMVIFLILYITARYHGAEAVRKAAGEA